jgi:hypothetical protein
MRVRVRFPVSLSAVTALIAASVLAASGQPAALASPPPASSMLSTIVSGVPWKDTDGNFIQAHQGDVVQVGSTYYWIGLDFSGGSDYSDNSQTTRTSVACYSSPDLVHWTNLGDVLTSSSTGADLLSSNYALARPKVVHHVDTNNPSDDYWVMWLSYINKTDSTRVNSDFDIVVAQSSTVCGQYSYVEAPFQPVPTETGTPAPSGDIGMYQDGSNAYLISADSRNSSASNDAGLYIYQLTADDEHIGTEQSYVPVTCPEDPSNPAIGCKEAPALFKASGFYFLLASETTGWRPNENWYISSPSLAGLESESADWQPLADPITTGTTTTYISQTMEVLPISGTSGITYIYMGDRHNSSDKTDSFYVWQPLQFNLTGGVLTLSLPFYDSWNLNLSAGTFTDDGTPYFNLTNLGSGEALDATATGDQGSLDGSTSQEWQVVGDDCYELTGTSYVPYYLIINNSSPQVALAAAATAGSTAVELDPSDCTNPYQEWEIISVSGGPYLQLVNRATDWVLAVSNGSVDQESNSETTTTPPVSGQQWSLTEIPSFWAYTAEGNVDNEAGGPWFGSPSADNDNVTDIVGMAVTNDGGGYWLVGADGTVYSYGDASTATSNIALKPCSGPDSSDIVGVTGNPGPSGGFWAFTDCGSVYNEDGAPWFGSLYSDPATVTDITGMAAGSDADSYWLVGSDGTIYSFSQNAPETTSSITLKPCDSSIIRATGDPGPGGGFWAYTPCGSVYNEGGAPWFGSLYTDPPTVTNIAGIAATPDGQGYWLAGSDGSINNFGDATASGSFSPQNPLIGIVANPNQ